MTRTSVREKAASVALAAAGVVLVTLAIRVSYVNAGSPPIGGFVGGLAAVSLVLLLRAGREADPLDERWQHIHQRSLAAACILTVAGSLGAYFAAEASGGDGSPYALVALSLALCYLGARAWYRWRA
jgi:multisubunit Na+/H+ antiporter MnhB subunit